MTDNITIKRREDGRLVETRDWLVPANLYGANLSGADLSRAYLPRTPSYQAPIPRAPIPRAPISRGAALYARWLAKAKGETP